MNGRHLLNRFQLHNYDMEIQPQLVVVQSTGGLERQLVRELYAAGIPLAMVNPHRVREFAKAIGLLAKTDGLDARLLARFGQATNRTQPDCQVRKSNY